MTNTDTTREAKTNELRDAKDAYDWAEGQGNRTPSEMYVMAERVAKAEKALRLHGLHF